ncbi:hypothetical protein THAOC_26222, partial [Thalassiosira oceanica]
ISDEQPGAVEEDEVATGVHGVLPLPMGIAREDRCCRSAQISDEQPGAVEEDEVATGVHGVLPLPMGIAREDRFGDDNGPGSEPPPRDRIGMSRRSCRAAGGLRRPSESRAFLSLQGLLSTSTTRAGSSRDRWTCDIDYSMTQGRTGDPKTMVGTSGIIGIVPSPSRRHRRIPSASP